MSTVSKIPQNQAGGDRDFFRIDGHVYLHVETVTLDQGTKQEVQGLYVPTFSLEEDDIVGLSIDAFGEHVMTSEMDSIQKAYWMKMQQIVSMMKRCLDVELLGKKQKLFKKLEVTISGSTLDFPSSQGFLAGQALRLALFFPRFPYTYLCVIGEVTKSEKKDSGYWVKTQFKDISEKNQDEILRFVNQLQRDSRRR